MKHDIVRLLSEMLKKAGMETVLDNDLNNHSTISLTMTEGIPTINIRDEDDEVWVWATLLDQIPDSLAYCSADLLPLMTNYNENVFYAGQPCLYPINDSLELRALVKEQFLTDPDEFLIVLENFLSALQEYRSVLI